MSNLRFSLRTAKIEDASDLRQFCWWGRSLLVIEDFLQHCLERMQKKRGLSLIAEKDGRVIGFGLLTVWSQIGEISDLIVTPNLRGYGIGTEMIQRFSKEAVQLDLLKLEIGAARSNPRAYKLYERLGFVPERSLKLNLGQGLEPVTYLVKTLEPDE